MIPKVVMTEDEVLEIDSDTGEILESTKYCDFDSIKQIKMKALKVLSTSDFVMINGTWEAKRVGLIKLLSSLPLSYSWTINSNVVNDTFSQVNATLKIHHRDTIRSADSVGICEFSELKGTGGRHFMNTRAETRALKRAIETLFGSVINYFVVNYLIAGGAYANKR